MTRPDRSRQDEWASTIGPWKVARASARSRSTRPSRANRVAGGCSRRPNRSKWVDRGRSRRPRSLEFARGERPGASEGAPKRPKSTSSRDGERRTRQFGRMARSRNILGCFFDETRCFLALSLCVRTLRSTSTAPASKNEGLAYRSARRGGRTTCPRKTTKIDRKIDPKSIEVGHSGYVKAPKSIEVGRSGQSKRPSRSKWLDRARSRRPRSLVASSHWRANPKLGNGRWAISL